MVGSAAANLFQVYRAQHPAPIHAVGRIARLMGPLEDAGPPTTELKHFGHERKPLQLPHAVQGLENLFLAPNLNPFTGVQF
jgi:hypothetical protein